jgi:hypothetical protein
MAVHYGRGRRLERAAPAAFEQLLRSSEAAHRARPSARDPRWFDRRALEFIAGTDAAPTLLLAEDLHWFDEPSAKLLFALCRALHAQPNRIAILMTTRTDDGGSLAPELATMLAEGQVEALPLSPLSPRGVEQLICASLVGRGGEAARVQAKAALAGRSNPLRILRALRRMLDRPAAEEGQRRDDLGVKSARARPRRLLCVPSASSPHL